ncbi:MAG: hypothetical protein WBV82_24305 [Myxococcaceae bacterium]
MATSFTAILFQRQHFGNDPGTFDDVEPNVPFAGPSKSFSFNCPGVDSSETAFIVFQARDVDHSRNVLQINGIDVFGGLPPSPARDAWNANILLVEVHHQLKETGNVLHVESRTSNGSASGDIDDFIVDNIVIVYKVRDASVRLPTFSGDLGAFLKTELMGSIGNVKGSGGGAEAGDQHNEYVLPTPSQLAAWRTVFRSLLAGSWGSGHLQARQISGTYNVVEFGDTPSGRTYYVLMEGLPGAIPAPAAHPSSVTITDPADPTRRGWGTYVFDPQPQRALSLSAPHPMDDLETEDQAIEAYLVLRARTLLLAGTDRDQNIALATCAQSLRPYLEADVSHTAESVFQIAFEEIYSSDAITWHLQFHGNADACNQDVFLSNGVIPPPAMLHTLGANIAAASAAAAQGGPVLTVDVYDSDGDCQARGTDNMQMRFASGRPHASICADANLPLGPSRFIHVEQRRDARRAPDPGRPPGRNRGVVLNGIRTTFP